VSLTGVIKESTTKRVSNTGFWPDLSHSDFITQYRIPEQFDDELLAAEITTALLFVNSELTDVENAFEVFAEIEQLDFDEDNTGDVKHHYTRAVFSLARSQLIPLFITTNRKDAADNAHDQWADSIDFWQDRSANSVEYILKRLSIAENKTENKGEIFKKDGYVVANI